jgi:hypothetical protein
VRNLVNRLVKLEAAATGDNAGSPSAGVWREYYLLQRHCRDESIDLWGVCVDVIDLLAHAEPPADGDVLAELAPLAEYEPPGLRYYSFPRMVLDFARHVIARKQEDAERAAFYAEHANKPTFNEAWRAFQAKWEARRDPRAKMDRPPVEFVAREIVRLGGLPAAEPDHRTAVPYGRPDHVPTD